jgi:hypothetical protein
MLSFMTNITQTQLRAKRQYKRTKLNKDELIEIIMKKVGVCPRMFRMNRTELEAKVNSLTK